MKKNLLFLASVVVVAVAAVLIYMVVTNNSASAPAGSVNSAQGDTEVSKLQATQQTVAVIGTVKCLSPSDNTADSSLTQSTNCAVGLQKDDGASYELNAKDSATSSDLTTGKKVKVTGTLSQGQSNVYQTSGTIQVQSVTPLQ